MAMLLYRLGALSSRNKYRVLAGWLVAVAAVAALGVLFGGTMVSARSIPGSPAQVALNTMDRHFPGSDNQSAEIVLQAPRGHVLDEPDLRTPVNAGLASAAHVPGVTSVSSPAAQTSPDGRTSVVQVIFSTPKDGTVPARTLDGLKQTGAQAERAGASVIFGGDAFKESPSAINMTEIIGVLVTLVILVITFGSMLAAGLPLLTAILGVAGTMMAMIGLSSVVGISSTAPVMAMMLGLAVGIDYALFIVSRHRSQLAQGMPVQKSIAKATATAGSAVVFAGTTVVVALVGLTVARVPMLTSMGLTAAGAVTVSVLLALTLLPALLSMAGDRLIPKPGSRAARRETRTEAPTMGTRWVTAVTRRPKVAVVTVVLGLLVLAIPALQLRLALNDNGSEPKATATRQAYDTVSHAFGPGANGPLIVLVEGAPGGESKVMPTADRLVKELDGTKGVAFASPAQPSPDGQAARIQVIPTTGPRTSQTSHLVGQLRDLTEKAQNDSGTTVAVTGITAISVDIATKLSGALLPFTIVVVGMSLLLLMVAFRSIAIPIKATLGFLLSVGASFGSIVAVFQWGWLSDALGVPSTGPIASFVPILVMAVLFGLAMDYEVFLVSSMRERYVKTRDSHDAIVTGARHSARVVTTAGLIMIAVFASFMFKRDPNSMPIALALGFGVLVDAFAVRMTLVPAVLKLLGDRAWYLPRWLDRILPSVDVEGSDVDTDHAGTTAPAKEPALHA
ncbi:MMPL family transporter [Streptomyces sp. NPDC051569]|uniref:MMPL family transporter n=1 Tax=Streptomyces sp. NPDC051569 TaxID=3365661 RepID=UPI00378AB5C5